MKTFASPVRPSQPAIVMLGALAALLILTEQGHAERELVPLGRLFAGSSHVVLGDVVAVSGEGTSTEVATVRVTSVVAGPTGFGPNVPVAGSPLDAEGHGFHSGQRLILFLADPLPSRPGVFRITEGAGVFGKPDDPGPVSGFLGAARDHAGRVPLAALLPYLRAGGPVVPIGLMASALEELALVADPLDAVSGDDLVALACGGAPAVHPLARRWALGHVGRLRLEAARPCLAALVTVPRRRRNAPFPPGDRMLQAAAVDSLVHLGGQESVGALEATLSSLSRFSPCDPIDLAITATHGIGLLADRGELVRGRVVGKAARRSLSTALTSTAVHSLGLIGDTTAKAMLRRLSLRHPNPLIRSQATETLARLNG